MKRPTYLFFSVIGVALSVLLFFSLARFHGDKLGALEGQLTSRNSNGGVAPSEDQKLIPGSHSNNVFSAEEVFELTKINKELSKEIEELKAKFNKCDRSLEKLAKRFSLIESLSIDLNSHLAKLSYFPMTNSDPHIDFILREVKGDGAKIHQICVEVLNAKQD